VRRQNQNGGTNNTLTITQTADDADAGQDLTGSNNTVTIVQGGSNNKADQSVTGSGNTVSIDQKASVANSTADQYLYGPSNDNIVSITQQGGTDNYAKQEVNGDQHETTITQTGSNHYAYVKIGTSGIHGGQDNKVTVTQSGLNQRVISDVYRSNEVYITHEQMDSSNVGTTYVADHLGGIHVCPSLAGQHSAISMVQDGYYNQGTITMTGGKINTIEMTQTGDLNTGTITVTDSSECHVVLNQIGNSHVANIAVTDAEGAYVELNQNGSNKVSPGNFLTVTGFMPPALILTQN
jgi:hypothetical protein